MGYYTTYNLGVQPYHRPSLTAEELDALEKEIDLMGVFVGGCVDDGFYSDSGEFQGDHPGWKMGDRPVVADTRRMAGTDRAYAAETSADQCVLCTV